MEEDQERKTNKNKEEKKKPFSEWLRHVGRKVKTRLKHDHLRNKRDIPSFIRLFHKRKEKKKSQNERRILGHVRSGVR